MIYTCSTVSLCLLEFFVHFDPEAGDIILLNLEYCWADIPETLLRLDVREPDLPMNWKEIPWPHSTQELGTEWMTQAEYSVVSVPSVVVPMERNFLINPAHPAFSRIQIGPPSTLSVDPRLFSR